MGDCELAKLELMLSAEKAHAKYGFTEPARSNIVPVSGTTSDHKS